MKPLGLGWYYNYAGPLHIPMTKGGHSVLNSPIACSSQLSSKCNQEILNSLLALLHIIHPPYPVLPVDIRRGFFPFGRRLGCRHRGRSSVR